MSTLAELVLKRRSRPVVEKLDDRERAEKRLQEVLPEFVSQLETLLMIDYALTFERDGACCYLWQGNRRRADVWLMVQTDWGIREGEEDESPSTHLVAKAVVYPGAIEVKTNIPLRSGTIAGTGFFKRLARQLVECERHAQRVPCFSGDPSC